MLKQKTSKNIKGITLVSLVVTIIVLLILAGIAITLIMGENGIFERGKQAKKEHEIEAAREKLNIILLDLNTKKIAEKGREFLL